MAGEKKLVNPQNMDMQPTGTESLNPQSRRNLKVINKSKQSSDGETIYIVETPNDIFWSKRKMDAQYRHVSFLWRDRARYKELTEFKWGRLSATTKKSIWEIV